MKNLFYVLGILFFLAACNQGNTISEPKVNALADSAIIQPVKDGVFIHITESYNDPHRVLMPLKMANIMAKDKDVLVYLDIHAVELVKKDAKDLTFGEFEPLKQQLQDLINKGVGIYACPTCMKESGISPEDLMEGIQVAQKDKFFTFTKGRIITLDY